MSASEGRPSGFEAFVVLASNRDAFAAARRWARPRARTANPLAIMGASAVGKSHLARAALAKFSAAYGSIGAVRTTAEQVLNEIFAAQRSGSRAELRDARALVIEHAEDLIDRPALAGLLFGLIDEVAARGCPVLITVTCDSGHGRLRLPATSRVIRIECPRVEERRELARALGANSLLARPGPLPTNVPEILAAVARQRFVAYLLTD